MTLTVRGKSPAPPTIPKYDHQTCHVDEGVAWRDLTTYLNLLYCDGPRLLVMRNKLARLDRICASRSLKLDTPALQTHPGFCNARDEFLTWNAQAINLQVEVNGLTADLRRHAKRADECFSVLRPEIQEAIAVSQRWIGTVLVDVVPALGDVKALPCWKFLLKRWHQLFAEVPF